MTERVALRFRGLMLEKFLQRALGAGVRFDSVRREGRRQAVLVTDAPGARVLMALAERFALDVAEVSRGGPGALARRVRRRWTLPAALAVCGLLSIAFLSRLWIVDVRLLDESGDSAPILEALDELGLGAGAPMRRVNAKELSLSLQALCPEFSYVGVRAQGVRLLVEATRARPAPDLYDPAAARDLVASEDALLISLDVMAGTAAVQVGQVVKKGQVLIRGEERDGRETTRGVCALGAAVGRVWRTGEAEAPRVQTVPQDTGRVSRVRSLTLLNWSFPIERARGYATQRLETRMIPIGGLIAPLKIEEITYIEQRAVTAPADPEALRAEIEKIAMDRALSSLPQGVQPVDKWVDYSMIEGDSLRARAVVEIRRNVAVARGALNS